MSPANDPTPHPRVQDYADYRVFLNDAYRARKLSQAGFSFRLFASRSGFKSPNYLQLVMQGARSLNEATALRVAKALKLTTGEQGYFVALVKREHAQSNEEQFEAERTLLRAAGRMTKREIPQAQAEVLSHWYHMVVRELVFLPDFEPTGAWVSRRMRGLITPAQAEHSLELLLRAGFFVQKKNRLEAAEPAIDTGDTFGELRTRQAHLETMSTWIKLLETIKPTERELGLLHVPVSQKRIPELKARLRAFQDELIGWALEEKKPDQVVQVGTYMIPITTSVSET